MISTSRTSARVSPESGTPAAPEDARPEASVPAGTNGAAPAGTDGAAPAGPDGEGSDNGFVDLSRLAWLGTVLVCMITVLVLVLQGYFGYAAVTFAVAVAASINLF